MKIWKYRNEKTGSAPIQWAEKLNISPRLLDILWNRGFRDLNSIDNYLAAPLKQLTHPDKWPQIPETAQILTDAILSGKKIAVWGDYDADGVTATALVLDVLEAHGIHALHHLPNRMKEGYGLNSTTIEELAKQGCEVILTVDCGINANDAIRYAKEIGMQIIVSDHHMPPDNLPEALAFANPRMKNVGDWPCPHLAGVGVAFYLMSKVNHLLTKHSGRKFAMRNVLDLVALGTLADVMQLKGENRILVRGGLKYIQEAKRPGIYALKEVGNLDPSEPITSGQTAYILAPRINAAGRMGDPNLALKLLRSSSLAEAEKLARELNDCNERRKEEENRIYQEAHTQAIALLEKKDYAGLVVYGENWHPGVIGIVASRLLEDFNKPTIVLCKDSEKVKGSGRSLEFFNMYDGLAETETLLFSFGGHKLAAGLSLAENNIPAFREAFNDVILDKTADIEKDQTLFVDGHLSFSEATSSFLNEIQLMQPFGPGNPEPIFVSPKLIVRQRSCIGSLTDSIVLELEDTESSIKLRAKIWRKAKNFPPEIENQTLQIAYTPRLSSYHGISTVEVNIKDYHLLKSDLHIF